VLIVREIKYVWYYIDGKESYKKKEKIITYSGKWGIDKRNSINKNVKFLYDLCVILKLK